MFTWLTNRLSGRHSSPKVNKTAEHLYAAIVAQARQPAFYSQLAIADTIPGRFELITLHMFIILDRLGNKGGFADEVAQELVDVMFQDMDDVARETGVGDMGVGPRIKKLARSFQSRLEYYKQTIDGDGEGNFTRGSLSEAILEIHYGKEEAQRPNADKLAHYVKSEQARLAERDIEELETVEPLFEELQV